jgi:aliphatic nitrilase
MGDRWQTVKVACVQAAPAFLDREGSLEKAVRLVDEAASRGARLIVFPEGFIPAHPVWYHFHAATSRIALEMAKELAENSVVVPGPVTEILGQAAARHGVYIVVGICERDHVNPGLLYNSQLFFGPEGNLLGKHVKIMPTVGERLVHAPGFGDTMRVIPTEYGPIGGLICGEASNPLAIFALASQGARIIAVSWPNHFSKNEHTMRDVILMASRALGYRANCFVLSAAGLISDEMRRRLPLTGEDEVFLSKPGICGGSVIVDPHGNIVAEPLGDEEDILLAQIDLGEIISAKLVHDYAGHYNRPEVFTLVMNTNRPRLFEERASRPSGAVREVVEPWPAEATAFHDGEDLSVQDRTNIEKGGHCSP